MSCDPTLPNGVTASFSPGVVNLARIEPQGRTLTLTTTAVAVGYDPDVLVHCHGGGRAAELRYVQMEH